MPISDQDLAQLELQDEVAAKQVSIEEKRALIREAKKRYGKDYLKFFSHFIKGGSGIDWSALKFKLS